MDFMNMTFAQMAEMIEVRRPELSKEINDLTSKVVDARQVLEDASQLYEKQPTDIALGSALDEADDKYWELQNKLDELHYENVQLADLARSFKYVSDCKDLLDVAALFVRN
jgi:predicted nuclease with TOPRIM domain